MLFIQLASIAEPVCYTDGISREAGPEVWRPGGRLHVSGVYSAESV